MAIEAVVAPNHKEKEPEVIHFGELYYYHDVVAGGLIIAKHLVDGTGAAVYSAQGIPTDPESVDLELVIAMATPKNMYAKILPYMREFMPVNLDDGTPGVLRLRNYPSIIPVSAYRSPLSYE